MLLLKHFVQISLLLPFFLSRPVPGAKPNTASPPTRKWPSPLCPRSLKETAAHGPICTKETLVNGRAVQTLQGDQHGETKTETWKIKDSFQFRLVPFLSSRSPYLLSPSSPLTPSPSVLMLTTKTRFCTEALQTKTKVIAGWRSRLPN